MGELLTDRGTPNPIAKITPFLKQKIIFKTILLYLKLFVCKGLDLWQKSLQKNSNLCPTPTPKTP